MLVLLPCLEHPKSLAESLGSDVSAMLKRRHGEHTNSPMTSKAKKWHHFPKLISVPEAANPDIFPIKI
jgi:hypothetical protein